jgi:hypothetical protein
MRKKVPDLTLACAGRFRNQHALMCTLSTSTLLGHARAAQLRLHPARHHRFVRGAEHRHRAQ